MIPKIIHYIWVGGKPLTPLVEKCLESFKKFCPDYTIKRWDETNFDIQSNKFCADAYDKKKWAFVSDVIRLYALVNEGGIYLDTDVELLKSLDNFLAHEAFSGFEHDGIYLQTGVLGAIKGFSLFKELLLEYNEREFILPNGSLNVVPNIHYLTNLCFKKGLVQNNKLQSIEGLTIYPNMYFCPKHFEQQDYEISEETVSIHHFAASWLDKKTRQKHKANELLIKYKERYGNKYKILFIMRHPFRALSILKSKK